MPELKKKRNKNDISQSLVMLVLIIISGGFQDAYSYFCRDHVFANAQTGNIVFLSVNIVNGNLSGIIKYLIPIFAFTLGAMLAKTFSFVFRKSENVFWKQAVLLVESAALIGAAFIPQNLNALANALVSFACAMQVLSFDRIYGNDFASTMCIGNIVKMSAQVVTAVAEKNKEALKRAGLYLLVIVIFAIGAGTGYLLTKAIGDYAILCSGALTFIASFHFCGREHEVHKEDAALKEAFSNEKLPEDIQSDDTNNTGNK